MKHILFLCTFIFVVAGCKSKKIIESTAERSKAEIIQSLLERNIDFRWYDAKMSAYIDSPDDKISGSIHAKMIKDSSVLISLKKFGIEAARIYADREDYTMLYRFDAAYETGHIDDIKKILAFSFNLEDLQQLLTGNIILPDTNATNITKEGNNYIVSSHVDDLVIKYDVSNKLELSKMTITDKANRTAVILYDDYKYVPGVGNTAYFRRFTVPYNSNGDATLELKISNIEINKPFDINFKIPNNYERIH